MEYRRLGNSGLYVSAISFGAMTFGGGDGRFSAVGTTQVDEATQLVDICLEAGVNLLDTANVYSAGRSEEILGQAVKGRRDKFLIATKVFGDVAPGPNGLGLSRGHIIRACEDSLRRLKTDYIDLYQVHNFDGMTPLEETLRAMDDLITSGKVRYIGSSNYSGWQLAKAAAVADKLQVSPYIGQQIQYSLIYRDAEHELLPAGIDHGVGALIWSPLAGGYLSGKFRKEGASGRMAATGRLKSVDDARGRRVLEVLEEVAGGYPGASMTQAALNWLLRKPGVSTVIVGARDEVQLKDNLGAANWTMSDEDVARLDDASGTRLPYPQSHQRTFSRGRNPAPGLLPVPERN